MTKKEISFLLKIDLWSQQPMRGNSIIMLTFGTENKEQRFLLFFLYHNQSYKKERNTSLIKKYIKF